MERDTFTATFVTIGRNKTVMVSRVIDSNGDLLRDHIWIEGKYTMEYRFGDTLQFTAEAYLYQGSKIGLKELQDIKKVGEDFSLVDKQRTHTEKKRKSKYYKQKKRCIGIGATMRAFKKIEKRVA